MKILSAVILTLLSTLGLGRNTNTPGKNLPLEAPSSPEAYSTKLVDALTSVHADDLTYVFRGYEQLGNKRAWVYWR